MILSDPGKASGDAEWLQTLEFLIRSHREQGLGFGFCLRNRVPPSYHHSCHNFYLLRDKYVGIWDAVHALGFEFDSREDQGTVQHFSDLYDCVQDSCASEDGGFFAGDLELSEIVAKLYDLAEPS